MGKRSADDYAKYNQNTMTYGYDGDTEHACRTTRGLEEEEGEYENASYTQERQAEQEESFGPGFVTEVDYNGESHAEDAVREPFEDEESGSEYHTPGERCGSGTEGTRDAKGAHILDVRQEPCRKHSPGWYKNRRVRSPGARGVAGRGEIRYEHDMVGCMVGAVGGATFAAFSSAGLATGAGAYAGCAIGVGFVELFGL
jgi:hypothetical protein